ncbi:MAG TPA: hypothetical protein VK564_09510 [Thermodesulfobacteriota bacterium]|nr:hypothetical protein [Thermodesulfobacteriota bacterium]
MFKGLLIGLMVIALPGLAQAADQLLYFEAQGIAGYSTLLEKPVYYSMNPDAEMQKPSIGFDYLKKFSGESGDWGTFALQYRLAGIFNGDDKRLEHQVYNAYFKVRTPGPYVWVGHNRPAFGLSSYFDSHGLILRTLAIQGFGYDRDWGVGLTRDFSWGDVAASLTTGTGMPAYLNGNYMSAGRVSYGVLSQDNYNIGLSLGYGNTMNTMGYNVIDPTPLQMRLAGVDMAYLRNNFEHRFEFLAGQWLGSDSYAFLYRIGMNLDPENRYKIEAQPTYWKTGNDTDFQMNLCFSAQMTSNLTLRLAYTNDRNTTENLFVLQLYFYMPVLR